MTGESYNASPPSVIRAGTLLNGLWRGRSVSGDQALVVSRVMRLSRPASMAVITTLRTKGEVWE